MKPPLPCITPADEMTPIQFGLLASALAAQMDAALAPTVPTQEELATQNAILANEELWQKGDKEGWFEAELARIFK